MLIIIIGFFSNRCVANLSYFSLEDGVTIQLKFTTISWADLQSNGILASQIAVLLPQDIANAIDISASDIIVLSENNVNGAIVLKLSVPGGSFDNVKSAISNPTSKLYTNGSTLTQYLDPTFPLNANSGMCAIRQFLMVER